MLTQIVGKTRLALAPMENHWWQTTLYITERGLTTSPMPYQDRTFAVDFDFIDHGLVLRTNEGATRTIPLVQRSVSDFYREYLAVLHSLEIEVELMDVPVEIPVAIPFAVDTEHRSYDGAAANRWWRVMVQVDRVLKRFRGRFEGKASPVHVFWGAFDLATTRFSGRKSPTYAGIVPNCPAYVMVEAYSRECSSCGFWPGGAGASEAAFYSYAYPEPPGYSARTVRPDGAYYDENLTCPTTSYAPPRRQTTRCSNSCKVHTKLQLISQRGTVLLWSGSNCERRCARFVHRYIPLLAGAELAGSTTLLLLHGTVAVGFSNGANISASVLLRRAGPLGAAVLLSPMLPFEPKNLPNLTGTSVFIGAARQWITQCRSADESTAPDCS